MKIRKAGLTGLSYFNSAQNQRHKPDVTIPAKLFPPDAKTLENGVGVRVGPTPLGEVGIRGR